ncbi:protein TonB [Paraburkholderia sp. WC7.3g]
MEFVPTGLALAATGVLLLVGLPRMPEPTPPAPPPAPAVTVTLADNPPAASPAPPPPPQAQPVPPPEPVEPPPPPATNVPTIPVQARPPKIVRPRPHYHEEPKHIVAPHPPQPVQQPPAPATPQVSPPAPPATSQVSPPAPPVGSPSVEGAYVGRLRSYIRTLTRYPTSMEARMERLQGKVMVQFVLSRAGDISDVTVVGSSGSPVLDQTAVSEVRGGAYGALPIPAEAWPGSPSHTFQVQMTFSAPE